MNIPLLYALYIMILCMISLEERGKKFLLKSFEKHCSGPFKDLTLGIKEGWQPN